MITKKTQAERSIMALLCGILLLCSSEATFAVSSAVSSAASSAMSSAVSSAASSAMSSAASSAMSSAESSAVSSAASATSFADSSVLHITPVLVAESQNPKPSTTTTIALSMTPAKGWHGYWVNGGDAGFGMQVEWKAPPGVNIGTFRYPVPDTLVISGLMNHVYDAPYALLAEVTLAEDIAPGTDISLSAQAIWLACTDEICVPEEALVTLHLTAGDGAVTAAERVRFDGWRAALPMPIDRRGLWEKNGNRLRFAIPLPAESESFPATADASTTSFLPHLFVETKGMIAYDAPQFFSRNGDWLIVESEGRRVADDGPDHIAALFKRAKGKGLSIIFDRGTVPPAGEALVAKPRTKTTTSHIDGKLFVSALLGAILGGVILNLMPCVFPILSLKALSLARAGAGAGGEKGSADGRAGKIEAIAYTVGAVFMALILGGVLLGLRAAGQQVGWAFQLQNPLSVLVLLVLLIAISAALLGVYSVPGFSGGGRGGGQALASRGGAVGGFWTGALAAFVATPCSGPFLGVALGATLVLPAWSSLPIFGGLGLGLALPFLAIAFVPALRRRLPRPGRWMETLRKWMGAAMFVTALALWWLLWRQQGAAGFAAGLATIIVSALLLAALGRAQRLSAPDWRWLIAVFAAAIGAALLANYLAVSVLPRGAPEQSATVAEKLPHTGTYSQQSLETARAKGSDVFVYFTADWCLTCKANEAVAIERASTQKAFRSAGVTVLAGDWTNGDPRITRDLARHGRNSVPLYLWYHQSIEEPEILPQILTPGLLIERARGQSGTTR